MKPVEKIGELLKSVDFAKSFEIEHQFKLLKIEMSKLQEALMQSENDKRIMEHHLNSTINDLKESNKKIRSLRRNELAETQRQIKFQDNKLRQITDSMTSSMAYFDRTYTYRYVNNKYMEWYGITLDQIIDKTIPDVIGEPFFNMVKPLYDRVFSGETIVTELDTKNANTDKRLVVTASYVPAYDLDGNNIGAYVYATDITENKKQTEVIKKSKMELLAINEQLKQYVESNAQLEQFAHIAAHDMKAPLRTISSFSSIIEKKVHDKLTEKEKEYFGYIKSGTSSLTALITDLLNYSKIDSKAIELESVDMNKIVQSVINYLDSAIRDSDADIRIVTPLAENLMLDRVKITQLVQNLIANAIKFVEKGQQPIIEIAGSENDDHYVFQVKDNGIGMAPEHTEMIFESFKQLNSKSRYEGTGLGLSICKRIVEDHGGEISVESAVGKGSCFTFTIIKNLSHTTQES